ncbi:MAG: glutathione peroxidase [Rhodospirillaceae bacterium]
MTQRLIQFFVLIFICLAGPLASAGAQNKAHEFEFISIDGKRLSLAAFRGKAILIVNTASMCGFTGQYSGLQKLWDKYKERGLVVLGVPSNDFGNQEPGTTQEIKEFCEINYGINFPMTEKVNVRKEPRHPFYQWTASLSRTFEEPRWNFHKYLIDKDGTLVGSFGSRVSPMSRKLTSAIETQLNQRTY